MTPLAALNTKALSPEIANFRPALSVHVRAFRLLNPRRSNTLQLSVSYSRSLAYCLTERTVAKFGLR
jgi:hypothetical protein